MVLGIYGSGGLGREVLDLASGINANAAKWEKIVFINDSKEESPINGAEIFTLFEFIANFPVANAKIIIALGEPKYRQALRDKVVASGYKLQTLIHPTAFVGSKTLIGEGTIIQFGCFVSCNVKVGDNVLLQPYSCVGHDSTIDRDSVVSTFVALSGSCKVGERAYIGAGVPVKEKITIGADSIVGMGSVVLRDIPEKVIALGNPARAMKNNESGRVFG